MLHQEQLELGLIEKKHMERLLELQKERLLLNNQNPYKKEHQFIIRRPHQNINANAKHLPLFKPDKEIQRLLYTIPARNVSTSRTGQYPPSIREALVAQKQLQNMLKNWKYQSQFITDDHYMRNIKKLALDTQVIKQLTPSGQDEIKQLMNSLQKSNRSILSLKEKYSAQQYEKKNEVINQTPRKSSYQRLSGGGSTLNKKSS